MIRDRCFWLGFVSMSVLIVVVALSGCGPVRFIMKRILNG